ncbi:hypothetical protein XBI1_1610005 [Xenorhabdus bovienii str. Intermedium]|uniref:Uncharacterized protein n=1 Tax=Xenorhabdus bovienii str. Intermedium TaxID=1379677 RepID=A0A077QHF4_XENBV|nr:hypothetical protein XBI1_1610005 [Xenorhabdus bovienii str. Intermedium]
MAGSLTGPVRIMNFIERERRAGRHWVQYDNVFSFAYNGSANIIRHVSYPFLYIKFAHHGTAVEISYVTGLSPSLNLYEPPSWNIDNVRQLPASMRHIIEDIHHSW